MSYVRQGTLFTFENFVAERDDNERLVLTLAALPDETLLCWLREQRQQRRDDYPYEMLWRCLIAKYVYQIKSYAELIRELRRNGSLRWLVGIETLARVPHDYHFSRLLKVLSSAPGLAQLQAMFAQLVSQLSEALPEMGARLAVDATAVHAYSNEMRKQKSDPDAAWSARPKRQRRRQAGGGVAQYLDFWFGYSVHLVVDCPTELPVAFEVTAANENETTRFEPLLEQLRQEHEPLVSRTRFVVADAGYDSTANCRYVLQELQALPIIKMRLTQKRADRDRPCQAATSLCTELGTQLCDSGHKMVYAGRDGDYLKWRCPVACGKAERCTAFGRCSASPYGTVRKISIWEDPRRFPGLARESKKWRREYRHRTAAERVNARLKDFLLLDELTVRGMNKVTAHVSLGLLVMLAGAAAMVGADKLERARQVVRLVA
jgi:IS5 family transposase